MIIRLLLAAAIMLGIYGAVRWVRDRGMPTICSPIEMKIGDLPTSLGEWKGETVALDPEMFKAIGAQMAVDRTYRDHQGRSVSLHAAVFAKPELANGLAHSPEICYPSSGWRIGEPKIVALDRSGTTDNAAKLMPVERRGETAYVLYWYQIDGHAYCTGDRQRQLIHGVRGRPTFPAIVKVMLHTVAPTPEAAEKTLMSLAAETFAWTQSFH